MGTPETTPEQMSVAIVDMPPIDKLHVLEALHRRILDIGGERAKRVPLIEDAPSPGLLGGQFAKVRRTLIREDLFYVTHVDGTVMEGTSFVPLLPADEYELLGRINQVGFSILATMTPDEMQLADRTRPRYPF